MTKITAQEAEDQVTLDGSFRAKHDGTKVIIRGHGRIFEEYKKKFQDLEKEGKIVIKEERE